MKILLCLSVCFILLSFTPIPAPKIVGFRQHESYTVYTFVSHNESVINIQIHNLTTGFPIDTNHVICEYQCSFWSMYYPISSASSDPICSFYVTEQNNETQSVVIRFRTNTTSHIKILCFRGTYQPIGTWTFISGSLMKAWESTVLTLKKVIIDALGDQNPKQGA